MLLFLSLDEAMVSKVGLINNVQFKYVSMKIHGHTSKKISIRYKLTFRTKNNMLLKIAKSISKCMKTYSVFYLYNSLYNIRIRFKVYSRHVLLYC